jgi:hypothetical protein
MQVALMGNNSQTLLIPGVSGEAKEKAQIQQSGMRIRMRAGIGLITRALPKISIFGLVFCFGWIAGQANYKVADLTKKVAIAKVQVPALQHAAAVERKKRVEAEKTTSTLIQVIAADPDGVAPMLAGQVLGTTSPGRKIFRKCGWELQRAFWNGC